MKLIFTWVQSSGKSVSVLRSIGHAIDIRSYGSRYNYYDNTQYAVVIANDNKFERK